MWCLNVYNIFITKQSSSIILIMFIKSCCCSSFMHCQHLIQELDHWLQNGSCCSSPCNTSQPIKSCLGWSDQLFVRVVGTWCCIMPHFSTFQEVQVILLWMLRNYSAGLRKGRSSPKSIQLAFCQVNVIWIVFNSFLNESFLMVKHDSLP